MPQDPATPDRPRRLSWAGTFNVRDVGGYAAAGGTTRWGRLYRGDSLAHLDDHGRRGIVDAGIRTVIDLRTAGERRHFPDALDGVEVDQIAIPVLEFDADTGGVPAGAPSLEEVYATIVADAGPRIAHAIAELAEPGALPGLVHCTAGKDRTGLVTAFTLSAVGVDDADVIADFALSRSLLSGGFLERARAQHELEELPFDDRVVELYVGSHGSLLETVFDQVRDTHGSVEGYLRHHGLRAVELTRLHEALVA